MILINVPRDTIKSRWSSQTSILLLLRTAFYARVFLPVALVAVCLTLVSQLSSSEACTPFFPCSADSSNRPRKLRPAYDKFLLLTHPLLYKTELVTESVLGPLFQSRRRV